MAGYTLDQLQALIAQHGGEVGRTSKPIIVPDPVTPNIRSADTTAANPLLTIQLRDGKSITTNFDPTDGPNGSWNIDKGSTALNASAGSTNPLASKNDPRVVKDATGNVFTVNPDGSLTLQESGATVPGSGTNGGPDLTPAALNARTAQANELNTATRDQQTASYQDAQTAIAKANSVATALDAATRAGTLSETQRQDIFDNYLKGQQQDLTVNTTATTAGQDAAANAVSELQYQSTPGFARDFAAGLGDFHPGAASPSYQPSDFQIQLPDLNAIANRAMQATLARLKLPAYQPPTAAAPTSNGLPPGATFVAGGPASTPPVAPAVAPVASLPSATYPPVAADAAGRSPFAGVVAGQYVGPSNTAATLPTYTGPALPAYSGPAG